MFRAQQKRVVTPGRMPSIIWQAFSTQATEGYFTSADQEKLIAVYCHAGKAAPPLPTSQNHHVDPSITTSFTKANRPSDG